MKFETRLELKTLIPIIALFIAQAAAAIAWGASLQERVGKLEATLTAQTESIKRIDENLTYLIRELNR